MVVVPIITISVDRRAAKSSNEDFPTRFGGVVAAYSFLYYYLKYVYNSIIHFDVIVENIFTYKQQLSNQQIINLAESYNKKIYEEIKNSQ